MDSLFSTPRKRREGGDLDSGSPTSYTPVIEKDTAGLVRAREPRRKTTKAFESGILTTSWFFQLSKTLSSATLHLLLSPPHIGILRFDNEESCISPACSLRSERGSTLLSTHSSNTTDPGPRPRPHQSRLSEAVAPCCRQRKRAFQRGRSTSFSFGQNHLSRHRRCHRYASQERLGVTHRHLHDPDRCVAFSGLSRRLRVRYVRPIPNFSWAGRCCCLPVPRHVIIQRHNGTC